MISRQEFVDALCQGFENKGSGDVVREFSKIRQLGTVEQYQERFEELKSLMLAENPYLS